MANYTSKTALNHAKNFDPYKVLKQASTDDGLPAYTLKLEQGLPVLDESNRTVMVPLAHIDSYGYRDWFEKEYPDGRTEIVRHTPNPVVATDEKGSVRLLYPEEVFEVKFYLHKEDRYPKTSGFGRAENTDDGKFDAVSAAISKAFINGMKNMGAGVDMDQEEMVKSLPDFIERTQIGKKLDPNETVPPKGEMLDPEAVKAQTIGVASEYTPLENVKISDEKTPETATEVAAGNVPAETENEVNPVLAKMMPAFTGEAEQSGAEKNEGAANGESESQEDFTAEAEATVEEAEADTSDAEAQAQAIEEDIIAMAGKAKGHAEATAAPVFTEKAVVQEETEANAENLTPIATETVAKINPGEVVFNTIDPADKLSVYKGITMEQLYEQNKAILNMICKPTFKWEERVPKDVYNAALALMGK